MPVIFESSRNWLKVFGLKSIDSHQTRMLVRIPVSVVTSQHVLMTSLLLLMTFADALVEAAQNIVTSSIPLPFLMHILMTSQPARAAAVSSPARGRCCQCQELCTRHFPRHFRALSTFENSLSLLARSRAPSGGFVGADANPV